MTTSITTTTADEIGALLDDLTHALADVPGRTPQDAQNAATLLTYIVIQLHGTPDSQALLNTFHARGVDTREARQVARALRGLALRLGAWLGRAER
jgi:hypothetical protein